jgi:uncharacterized protein YndB with AHSA1/START domain
MDLPHTLDRAILIEAPRDVVFRYFTDDARWASWWGAGSTIDARPGGRVYIRLPGAVEVTGEVIEVASPTHIVFTYGFVSGKPIPPGHSRVTIRLETAGRATRVRLQHEFADPTVRDEFVQGWRYQLSLFANVVADEVHRDADRIIDAWFAAWAETNEAERSRALNSVAVPNATAASTASKSSLTTSARRNASWRACACRSLERCATVREPCSPIGRRSGRTDNLAAVARTSSGSRQTVESNQ